MQHLSYENEFCMQFHFHANQSHFLNNSFAPRLALKQRHKGTQKWPISLEPNLAAMWDIIMENPVHGHYIKADLKKAFSMDYI